MFLCGFSIAFLGLLHPFAHASQADLLATARNDYDYAFQQYRDAHKEYELAKSKYQTYKNLTSETVAIEKTSLMLQARDQVMITFMTMIEAKLAAETNVSYGRLGVISYEINEERDWYLTHQEKLPSAATIADLISLSREAEKRYETSAQLAYRALFEMFLYKEEAVIDLIEKELSETEALLQVIREAKDKDTSVVERWLINAQNKYELAMDKFRTSQGTVLSDTDLKTTTTNYTRGTSVLEQTNQYLKEVNQHLIEIMREIKRAD